MDQRSDGGVPRRRFLEALALAPAAAAAGCAGAGAERRADGDPAPAEAGATSGSRPPAATVAAVRAFAVAPDAEPAFVFRAAGARPGAAR